VAYLPSIAFYAGASVSGGVSRKTMPAVDVVESEKAYEVTAELPGMDEKNIEIKVANGVLNYEV
jgi:HSP20 family molecular chaperone IbpA